MSSRDSEDCADEEDANGDLKRPLPPDLFSDCKTISSVHHETCQDNSIAGLRKKQKMAPKKAAARNVDVMSLETLAASELEMLKSLTKLERAIVVPRKAESYPNLEAGVSLGVAWELSAEASYSREPVAMMAASRYSLKL